MMLLCIVETPSTHSQWC